MQRLQTKIALVTGGAEGLGKAIAQRLAAEGARVVITDVQVAVGQAAAKDIGGDFVAQDVTNEPQWNEVVADIRRRHGGLHILVNNAGILGPRDAANPENTRLTDWRKIFTVNVEGVFLGCRTAIPAIHASGGGSIINISSIAGLLATPYATAYGCSKAAVRQLTKSVAQHCAEQKMKIRCNSVHPGNVRTPLLERHAAETAQQRGVSVESIFEEAAAATSPMGEITLPQDIAAAVAFLASEDSRHMTGAMMVVDAGTIYCDTYRRPKTDGR